MLFIDTVCATSYVPCLVRQVLEPPYLDTEAAYSTQPRYLLSGPQTALRHLPASGNLKTSGTRYPAMHVQYATKKLNT